MNIHFPHDLKPSRSAALSREVRRLSNQCNHLFPLLENSRATKTHVKIHIDNEDHDAKTKTHSVATARTPSRDGHRIDARCRSPWKYWTTFTFLIGFAALSVHAQ